MDKKHEDVAMVAQIDKTSVFQEGTLPTTSAVEGQLQRLEESPADIPIQRESSTRVLSRRGNAEWCVAQVLIVSRTNLLYRS
jgi:hypothetical protein